MKLKTIAFATLALTLAACGNESKPQNPELLKGENFATVQDGTNITLSFDAAEMRVYGGIVNRYNGGYTANENKITFTPFMSTMMMGEEKAMATERNYFAFMATASEYKLDGSTLTISDLDGKKIVFKKLDTDLK